MTNDDNGNNNNNNNNNNKVVPDIMHKINKYRPTFKVFSGSYLLMIFLRSFILAGMSLISDKFIRLLQISPLSSKVQ